METKMKKEFDKVTALWNRAGHGVSGPFRRWVENKVVHYPCYLTLSLATCLHCGETFENENLRNGDKTVCPHCGRELTCRRTTKSKFDDIIYVQELTVSGGYQVIRTYCVLVYARKDRRAEVQIHRVYDWYIPEKGRRFLFSSPLRAFYAYRNIPWTFGEMRPIKHPSESMRSGWNIGALYPHRLVQPWARQRGFGRQVLTIDNFDLLQCLMDKPHIETCCKAKQDALCWYLLYRGHRDRWRNIKIALRHGLKFRTKEDVEQWFDYLSMLDREGKDTLNPKYICPDNISGAHDAAVARLNERTRREREEQERREWEKELAKLNKNSKENMALRDRYAKIMDWSATDGVIVIAPLSSLEDFYNEGKELHHCVYAAGYYKRKDSIILGARVNGQRMETIELSSKDFHIRQCRGKFNQDSAFHTQILALLNRELPSLRKCYRQSI